MTQRYAQLTLDSSREALELPIYEPTLGKEVINIAELSKNNAFTFDPGFVATASCESKITYIDGEKGVLLYRGYPIEQLAEHSNFLEVCHLLLRGQLPNQAEATAFENNVKYHTMLHEQVYNFVNGFRRDAHPMSILLSVVGALSSFYHDSLDIQNPEHREVAAYRLIAKIPTIAAMCYKYSIGHPFMPPRNDLSYAENFLHMLFAVPSEETKINPVLTRAMDRIFILHADHEQNASTSTVRLAGSTGANPFACISGKSVV